MSTMDFQTALEGYWLAKRRAFSKHTILDYELTFKRFSQFMGSQPVGEIKTTDIHAFLNTVQKRHKLADKTMSNIWAALSSFFSWAEIELRISHPIRGIVSRPTFRRAPIEPYTKAEIFAMLSATEQTATWRTRRGHRASSVRPTAARDKAIIITLVDTGIRASELCNLLVRDYEDDSGKLIIVRGKGNKRRTVYLGNAGRKYLWRYLISRNGTKTTEPLFVTRKGTALSSGELLNMIVATARRAAVSHANCHRFRHTFAITFLRNGGNVLELQRLLGHEKMDTLQIYVQLAQSDLAHAQAAASPADHWGL